MASLRDVARAAGVSTATVSNVLNGHLDRVGEATVKNVLASVRALKYRPTPLEHKQKTIQTQKVGFIVTDMTESGFRHGGYHLEVLQGVLEGAASRGHSLTIFIEKVWDDVGLAVRRNYDGRCDGVVMLAPQSGNEILEMLQARGTPIVTVGSTPWLPNISSVDVDNHAIGAQAARHLYELGHRRLAFVVNSDPQISARERMEGFIEEALMLGLPEHDVLCIQPRDTESETIANELMRLPRPTGAFFWHDGLAVQAVCRLREKGVSVPEDLSVVSVDDSPIGSEMGLTTFKNPTYELGKRAAKVLIDRIVEGNDATEVIRLAPELVVRKSVRLLP